MLTKTASNSPKLDWTVNESCVARKQDGNIAYRQGSAGMQPHSKGYR